MRMTLTLAVFGITCLASDVLVPGDPPLTRSTVVNVNGILEWLAGSPLAPQQRTMIENTLTESWRQHNTEQIRQWSQLSALQPLLATLDGGQRGQLRENLLSEMRKQGNPLANLAGAPASAPVPASLTGRWEQRGGSSSITYRDAATGSYAAPTGNINRYTFNANGTYEYAELSQVSNYNCTIRVFGYDRGTYAVNGNTIAFTMQERSLEYRDTCNPSLNSNKNLPLEKQSFPYQIVRGQSGDELVLFDKGVPRWRYTRGQ